MKILQVCKHFYPRVTGVTAHVDHLGRELQALGHETAVTTWGDETGRESIHGLEVLRARNGDRQTAAKLIMDFRPDVIHAHSIWSTTDLAVKAARKLGRPYVITTHGTWQLLESSRGGPRDVHPLSRFWRRKIFWPSILRGAGAVIALNALEERDATEAGVSQDKLRRIPNAVDLELFSPAGSRTKPVRRPWPGRFTILFAGAMEANKGIFEAITAASMLRQSHPQARWLFCGEGPDLAHARKETSRAGLDEVVLFMDRVARQDMPDLYRSVDLVIVPSHMEAFSTVLLEAMASSLPCVGTDVGGTPEIIDDFRTGLIVPPGDSSALAQTVGWLAEHPAEAAALGRAGRKRAERNFGWRNVAARIADTYRQVLVPLAIVLLLGVFRPALAAQVAAVDILTMVDPRTGQAVSAGTSDWRGENPVWNGKEVRLSAARGETVAFQIVLLTDPGEDLAGINVQADLPGLAWRAFRAWHIWNTPEVAVPLGNEAPSFDIPSRLPEERRATRGVRAWATVVEIDTPREASPGPLDGHIDIRWKNGGRRLPIQVAVAPFALPDRPGFTLEMNSYGDYLRLLPADAETYRSIHRLFRHFRCTFTLVPYRQDGSALLDFLAPVPAADGAADFTAFDAALAGLFDGTAFADRQALSHFILPLRADWPCAQGTDEHRYASGNVAMRQALARHITAMGWASTRFQEFHNENPEHGAKTPWRLDEPASTRDLAGHERFLGYQDQARAGWSGNSPLLYRIDISRWKPLRLGLQRMTGRVTDWSVSADPRFCDLEAIRFFRSLGGQWLVAYGELDGFQNQGQSTPWTVFPVRLARFFQLGLDGFAQWQADRWQHKEIADVPVARAVLFHSNAAGARDFMWPGTALGLAGPMPSLRLFPLREGLNVLDYVILAGKHHPELAEGLRRRLAALSGAEAFYAFKAELAAILAERGDHETAH